MLRRGPGRRAKRRASCQTRPPLDQARRGHPAAPHPAPRPPALRPRVDQLRRRSASSRSTSPGAFDSRHRARVPSAGSEPHALVPDPPQPRASRASRRSPRVRPRSESEHGRLAHEARRPCDRGAREPQLLLEPTRSRASTPNVCRRQPRARRLRRADGGRRSAARSPVGGIRQGVFDHADPLAI